METMRIECLVPPYEAREINGLQFAPQFDNLEDPDHATSLAYIGPADDKLLALFAGLSEFPARRIGEDTPEARARVAATVIADVEARRAAEDARRATEIAAEQAKAEGYVSADVHAAAVSRLAKVEEDLAQANIRNAVLEDENAWLKQGGAKPEGGTPAQIPGNDPESTLPVETKTYADGSSATGPAPLPDQSPAEQDANTAAGGPPDSDDADEAAKNSGGAPEQAAAAPAPAPAAAKRGRKPAAR